MGSVSGAHRAPAIETVRQDWRPSDKSVGDVLTNISKLVLWPENTAAHIAAAAGCSVRQAERFLGGQCEWSGDAVAAVMQEILIRRGTRNLRVKGRD